MAGFRSRYGQHDVAAVDLVGDFRRGEKFFQNDGNGLIDHLDVDTPFQVEDVGVVVKFVIALFLDGRHYFDERFVFEMQGQLRFLGECPGR